MLVEAERGASENEHRYVKPTRIERVGLYSDARVSAARVLLLVIVFSVSTRSIDGGQRGRERK